MIILVPYSLCVWLNELQIHSIRQVLASTTAKKELEVTAKINEPPNLYCHFKSLVERCHFPDYCCRKCKKLSVTLFGTGSCLDAGFLSILSGTLRLPPVPSMNVLSCKAPFELSQFSWPTQN